MVFMKKINMIIYILGAGLFIIILVSMYISACRFQKNIDYVFSDENLNFELTQAGCVNKNKMIIKAGRGYADTILAGIYFLFIYR
jgi:hypothetical protein